MKQTTERLTSLPHKGIRLLDWQYRKLTWRFRSSPSFIIIGAQRSGTTSLYRYLAQHPQLLPSFRKEVHFFDGGVDPHTDNYQKGERWYRAHFPLTSQLGERSKTYEATPLYIFNPLSPGRMANRLAAAKLILLLRNPTERAISHYLHSRARGYERLPILDALKVEDERMEAILKDENYKSEIFIHQSYKTRGLYRQQIERYLQFFPSHQLLILSSTRLFQEPAQTLKRIFSFLDIDSEIDIDDLNPYNMATNRVSVDRPVTDLLDDYFRPHNMALFELLGEDFGW